MDVVMVTMDTMARDLLMPSLAMATMAMGMVMVMVMDTMDTMARDPLMLMPSQLPLLSQDMDTMAMDMVMDMDTAMATMDTATDTDMDTTDKQLKSFLLSSLEFSTKNEIGPFGTSHFQTFPKL